MSPFISVVSPVYNSDVLVSKLVSRNIESLEAITDRFEIVLVNDGSKDQSWKNIEEECAKNPKVIGINLSRNFGQHYAIAAGLQETKGDWIVVMDCDLQDRPEEISKLFKKSQEGFDVVLAKRGVRKDNISQKIISKLFSMALTFLTDVPFNSEVANFGIYSRKVIDRYNSYPESFRYFPVMIKWLGFNTAEVSVEHAAREEGEASYHFYKRLELALDVFFAFSDKPLRLVVKLGLIQTVISFMVGIFIACKALMFGYLIPGWASIMVTMWFISGLNVFCMGVLGSYLARVFREVKKRPIYIISERKN